jgi:hypothetical protein
MIFPSLSRPQDEKLEAVPDGGLTVYYLFRGADDKKNGGTGLEAFPDGLKMSTRTPTQVFTHRDWLTVRDMWERGDQCMYTDRRITAKSFRMVIHPVREISASRRWGVWSIMSTSARPGWSAIPVTLAASGGSIGHDKASAQAILVSHSSHRLLSHIPVGVDGGLRGATGTGGGKPIPDALGDLQGESTSSENSRKLWIPSV